MSVCTDAGRGGMLAKFMAGELGQWGRRQFTDHLVSCEHCQKEIVARLLERALSAMPSTEQEMLRLAIEQWGQ